MEFCASILSAGPLLLAGAGSASIERAAISTQILILSNNASFA